MKKALVLILLSDVSVSSQSITVEDPNSKLRKDLWSAGSRLSGAIKTDKAIYYPGEEMQVVVTYQNSTNLPLHVFDPFLVAFGSFTFYREGQSSLHLPETSQFVGIDRSPVNPSNLTRFAPGEVRSRIFDSSGAGGFVVAPASSGIYTLVFHSNLRAKLSVKDVRLDLLREVEVPSPRQFKKDGTRRVMDEKLFQKVFTLADSDGYHLCVQINPTPSAVETRRFKWYRDGDSKMSDLYRYLAPYRCLETTSLKINDIDMSYSADGSLFVISKIHDGSMLQHRLDVSNKLIP